MNKLVQIPLSIIGLGISLCFLFITAILPGVYLHYIRKLTKENCECSQNFFRDYITYYSIYTYSVLFLIILVKIIFGGRIIRRLISYKIILLLGIVLSVVFAYSLYHYQKKIIEIECDCAQKNKIPKIMKIHSIIMSVIIGFQILLLLGSLILKKKKSLNTN